MKEWEEFQGKIRLAVKEWFPRQCRNLQQHFHVYYLPSSPEHDGGVLISENQPANPEYKLAFPERLSIAMTEDQAVFYISEAFYRLPVLRPAECFQPATRPCLGKCKSESALCGCWEEE